MGGSAVHAGGKKSNMDDRERIRLEQNLYMLGFCLFCVGAVFLMLQQLLPHGLAAKWMVPCMFHAVTGLYCPGCGGTRAVAVLVRGQIGASFLYHPIVPYCAVVYLWFMVSHTAERIAGHRWRIGMRYRNAYLWIALGIVVINIAVKDIALTAFRVDLLKILDNRYF